MYYIFENLLKERGLRASDVSKATGIATSTFTEWKKGRSAPKIGKIILIADYFGISIDALVGHNVPTSDEPAVSPLSDAEISFLLNFRKLNIEGQEKVLEYVDDLVLSNRYIKTHQAGVVD